MTISEKVAYIQGMFDGMGLDKSESGEAKVLAEVLDVLKEIGDQLDTVDATLDEFGEEIDAISDDLADVEVRSSLWTSAERTMSAAAAVTAVATTTTSKWRTARRFQQNRAPVEGVGQRPPVSFGTQAVRFFP